MRFRQTSATVLLTHHLAFTKFTCHLKWFFGIAIEKIHDKITSNGFPLQKFRGLLPFKIALRVIVNKASETKYDFPGFST